MLGNNGQMKNFNAKSAKNFFITLKIFLRFAKSLRQAQHKLQTHQSLNYWKSFFYDDARNRDSSGNPFLWLRDVGSNWGTSSTKKIVADSPTRAVAFG